jgi:hypothetical protein
MAIGAPYALLQELKDYANAQKDTFDGLLTDSLDAATRGIEAVCHRQFNDADTASVRTIPVSKVLTANVAYVDDFHTTTGLVIETDDDGDGVFETTWTTADYQLEPLDGIMDGRPGWPYTRIRAVDVLTFPRPTNQRASLRVTARWGWAAVPKPVKQACLIVATEIYKSKDAPFGIAGATDFGTLRVRENPLVMKKLAPYIRTPILVF